MSPSIRKWDTTPPAVAYRRVFLHLPRVEERIQCEAASRFCSPGWYITLARSNPWKSKMRHALLATAFCFLVATTNAASAQIDACVSFGPDGSVICVDTTEENCDGAFSDLDDTCADLDFDFPLVGGCLTPDEPGQIETKERFACGDVSGGDGISAMEVCESFDGEYLGNGVFCSAVPALPLPALVILGLLLVAIALWSWRRSPAPGIG